MKHHVSTVFGSHTAANRAMQALVDAGIPKENISLLMNEDTRLRFYPERESSAGWGAAVGAVVGSLIGLAAAPPAGLFVAGPLATALGGAAWGAAGGGLVGALADLGVPEETARVYEERIEAGGIFVGVETSSKEAAERARTILRARGSAVAQERVVSAPPA